MKICLGIPFGLTHASPECQEPAYLPLECIAYQIPLFVLINMISSPLHIWLCQFKCGILPAHCQPHIGLEILKLEGKPVFGSWVTCCLPVDAPPAAAARIISTVYSETRRPACNSASQQLGVSATSLADLALWAECQAWWSRPPPARLSSTTRWGRRWNLGKVKKKKKGKFCESKCFIYFESTSALFNFQPVCVLQNCPMDTNVHRRLLL